MAKAMVFIDGTWLYSNHRNLQEAYGEDFQIDATFNLTALKDGTPLDPAIFEPTRYTLTIVENQPEVVLLLEEHLNRNGG